ncbi:hypothetical protein SLEP1_g58343 [Rubroshorea leprosula]|uniref:Uncharacterized protein n=1 Tax=Rubroshorea leprosula TaxID=152421 RepID=A0AAV5MT28_9ROSI|nr:hypothetical protein SLEP1_g58343 [Rubroshorea leprosula]
MSVTFSKALIISFQKGLLVYTAPRCFPSLLCPSLSRVPKALGFRHFSRAVEV